MKLHNVLGMAVLVWLGALLSARVLLLTLSLLLQAIVHCGPLFTVIRWSHSPTLTMQTRSFSVVGPTTWNGLPIDLRHLPNGACSQLHHLLKTVLFRLAWVGSASE